MIVCRGEYAGNILIPASKSDSQRAILAAALAQGLSVLINVGNSADELSMLKNIRSLGAEVQMNDIDLSIKGSSQIPTKFSLNVGESGLGVRLMSSFLLTQKGEYEINGVGSLITRSVSFFQDNFEGKIPLIKDLNGFLPLFIHGPFLGGKLQVSGAQSSQYISGLLMALPLAENDSELIVEDLNSIPYVQMTLDTLAKFGIEIQHENLTYFKIKGKQKYVPTNYSVERDWSSASYWLVASALGHKISVEGLNRNSLQADRAILEVFEAANCTIETLENRMFVRGENRKPFTFDAIHCPDLFPSLAAFAAFIPGKSTIYGLNRLVNKESNRGLTLQTEFGKLGIIITLDEPNNAMIIDGKEKIQGGRVFSNHDHRIAMSLAILGLFADSPIHIDHPEAVEKSYPSFWDDLVRLHKKTRD